MIADARPLQPEFVPGDVRHREGETDALTSGLQPIAVGRKTEPILLYGPSGTGKTCIARYAVDRLRSEVVDLDTQYVNCWEDYTRFKTLYRVLEGIGCALNVHRQSTPRDELVDRLRDALNDPYVVILDEVDQLEGKEVLYDLHRTSGLSLVLIANREEELFSELSERLVSRLHTATRIRFDRYGTDELVGILGDRVRWGLGEDCIDHKQLTRIAEAAAGDARIAIGILRAAAREADERGVKKITDNLIEDGIPEAKAEIRQKHVQKLTEHQRVLYDIIVEHGEIAPGELYEAYCERVDDPKTRRMLRNHLQKMQRYNLVQANGESRSRTYSPVS
jgi:orc1/cdc6 family replication initiation protein